MKFCWTHLEKCWSKAILESLFLLEKVVFKIVYFKLLELLSERRSSSSPVCTQWHRNDWKEFGSPPPVLDLNQCDQEECSASGPVWSSEPCPRSAISSWDELCCDVCLFIQSLYHSWNLVLTHALSQSWALMIWLDAENARVWFHLD